MLASTILAVSFASSLAGIPCLVDSAVLPARPPQLASPQLLHRAATQSQDILKSAAINEFKLSNHSRQNVQAHPAGKSRRQLAVPYGELGRVDITTPNNGTDLVVGHLVANISSNPITLDASSSKYTQLELWILNSDSNRCSLRMSSEDEILCASYNPTSSEPEPLTMTICVNSSTTNISSDERSQTFSYDQSTGIVKPIWVSSNTTGSESNYDDESDAADEEDDADDTSLDARDVQQPITVFLKFVVESGPTPNAAEAVTSTFPDDSSITSVQSTFTTSSSPTDTLIAQAVMSDSPSLSDSGSPSPMVPPTASSASVTASAMSQPSVNSMDQVVFLGA